MKSFSLGRFEYFVVAALIGVVASSALSRYVSLAESTRQLRFQLIANHFAIALANTRINWIVRAQAHAAAGERASVGQQVSVSQQASVSQRAYVTGELGGRLFYFSSQGWPVTMAGPVGEASQPSLDDCYFLWQGLLQNPPPLARGLSGSVDYEYGVVQIAQGCRYFWLSGRSGLMGQAAYFDYHPGDGSVRLAYSQ